MKKKILAILISEHFRQIRHWRAIMRRRFEVALSAKLGLSLHGDNKLLSKADRKAIALDLVDMVRPKAYISDQIVINIVEAYIHGEFTKQPG